jgi:hypothetical protein
VAKPGTALATLLNFSSSSSSSIETEEQYNTKSVLNAVVNRYVGGETSNPLFMQYMRRVQCIVNSIVSSLKKQV